MMRLIVTIVTVAVLAVVLGGCHGNTYDYHYGGHGHYHQGQSEPHYTGHYGSFGHPYGQHGYSPRY